jgi:mannose-1-phosphate guanylyltransferase/mannose-6-phosphate isomerase
MTPTILPVILCGGAGARLWPLSTAARPKQFLPLIGGRSTFQETAARVSAIPAIGDILVVANQAHRALIEDQLSKIGVRASLLLEPGARDSGPAIAAAAAWAEHNRPGAVVALVSADHHIPDQAAFVEAIVQAAQGALADRIVTLGLRPTTPSTAFGYIRPGPGDGALREVAAFVEKPDLALARDYVAQGCLWNSGNFICRPELLLQELALHAPDLEAVGRQAVASARTEDGALVLGAAFLDARKISIDHALMERTRRASVLPVTFAWSDIGNWSAVLDAAAPDEAGNSVEGDALIIDSRDCIVRAPPGGRVAVIGMRDIAVIATEDGSILVCDLSAAQEVKAAADHFEARRSEDPA